jgi:molecular chaperone HtpG
MKTGNLSVQTENILPIIKRYLYSDQEIFLRELVSNAVDATQKLKTLADRGEVKGDIGDTTISVALNPDAGTLTISDKGLGMTQAEVEKYITQIAFSGAKDFAARYENAQVIGHFGLGFYSAFMVADRVDIISKSYQADEPAVFWSSDGGTEYQIGEHDRSERGTDIVLHLSKDAQDYADQYRIEELLNKYCRFLPVPIAFGEAEPPYQPQNNEDEENNDIADAEIVNEEDNSNSTEPSQEVSDTPRTPKIINDTNPVWTRNPADLTDEDYLNFYRQLYPMNEEPLFWIHLNVDYPFKLTGVLYFPKLYNSFEVRRDRIQLYCNQVFVTDQTENIVPDFLMLLQGIIDSPDIPLNVSRSYLQSDPEVKKINKYISRKVGDKLAEIFKSDREGFEKKWEHIGLIVKYGMLSDDSFYDKAKQFCLLEETEGKFYTLDEYHEATKDSQTDKHGKTVMLYTTNETEQHSFVEAARSKQYSVLHLNSPIDQHFINKVEGKMENVQFKRVDADTLNHLIEKEESEVSILNEREEKAVTDLFGKVVANPMASVSVKALSSNDAPVQITKPEFMRRMKDMSKLGGGMDYMRNMPDSYQVTVNGNHPTISAILAKSDDTQQEEAVKQLYDLALLQQDMLKGADLTAFIKRSVELMK